MVSTKQTNKKHEQPFPSSHYQYHKHMNSKAIEDTIKITNQKSINEKTRIETNEINKSHEH